MFAIIGGNGFLGSYLIKNILETTNEHIIATYRSGIPFSNDNRILWVKTDVSDFSGQEGLHKVLSSAKQKVKAVYLAGYIKPDDVELHPETGFSVNIKGLADFIALNRDLLDCLYFSSTDMVMGESVDGYRFKETDIPHPINRYGRQKYICEQIVLEAGFNVFRCPLMLGRSLIPDRPHFIEHIERVVKNKEKFDILFDYYESSLDYDTVAKSLLTLISRGDYSEKIIHIAGDEKISKYEIAQRFCEENGLNGEYLQPLALKDCSFFVAKRGSILLDNSLLKKNLSRNIKIKV